MIDSVQKRRVRVFERWTESTQEVLGDPEVQARLGALGIRLQALAAGLFLPDIRHGVVSIPRSQQNTNNVCLLPRLHNDDELQPDITLSQPTPARRQKMAATLAEKGRSSSRRAVRSIVDRVVQSFPADDRDTLLEPPAVARVMRHKVMTDEGALFTSRPIVVTGPPGRATLNRNVVGAIGAHELVHAVDAEDATQSQDEDLYYSTYTEIRAYGVSGAIVNTALANGTLSRHQLDTYVPGIQDVEVMREQHGIELDTALNGNFVVDEQHYDNLVFDMFLFQAFDI